MTAQLLRNATLGTVVATRVSRASNPLSRAFGLLGCAVVAEHEGVWIDRCSAVHTIGMRATLDLYFLDGANKVLKIASAVVPNRLAVSCRHAKTVVELGARSSGEELVRVGDTLVLE